MTPSELSVRRYWDEVWSKGNVAAATDFYAPTFQLNGEETSVENFTRNAEAWLGHFSDFGAEVDKLFVCGDVVVSGVIYRATHTGDFETVPSTGKRFELSGIDISSLWPTASYVTGTRQTTSTCSNNSAPSLGPRPRSPSPLLMPTRRASTESH